MNLEETLVYLSRYGKPRIGSYSSPGWHCCVEMFVTGKGIAFEVKSDFGHMTPMDAARCCQQRLEEALVQIQGNLPALKG